MTPTDAIKASHTAMHAATAACERLQELADAQARAAQPDQGPDLATVRQAYEDASAAHALGEISAAELAAAQTALAAAEEAHQASAAQRSKEDAVQAGIQRRLALAQAELQRATEAEKAAHVAWVLAELKTADADYVRHGLAAASAMCRAESLKSWLQSQGLSVEGLRAFSAELRLPPVASASFAAVLEARPAMANNPGEAWQSDLFPRIEPAAARAALEAEMDAITAETPAPSGGGKLMAGARRLVRSLVQSPAEGAA